MTAGKFYFNLEVMKIVRANVPVNVAQVARQTYDKYGTVFPCLDNSEWINDIDISGNEFNSVYRCFGYALHTYVDFRSVKGRMLFSYEYTSRIKPMIDKMCELQLI